MKECWQKNVKEWITSTPEQTTSTTRIHSSGKWKRPPTVWVICNYDASHHQGINYSGVGLIIRNSNIMVRSWSVEWENFREEKLQHKQNWQLLYVICKHVGRKDILMWYLKWTMKQSTTSSALHIVSSIITYIRYSPGRAGSRDLWVLVQKNNCGPLKLILT